MNRGQTAEANFFGHPVGLRTLFLTEMLERMSFYGMRALLVLYMTGAVTGFNDGLGFSQIDAQAIYGIYVGMVYFMVVVNIDQILEMRTMGNGNLGNRMAKVYIDLQLEINMKAYG